MAWKDKLKRLKDEVESMISPPQGDASQQQQHQTPYSQPPQSQFSQYPPPPPVPSEGQIYWQPRFQADAAVTVEWDAKIGNGPDGWGNQELEHYTANTANAFHTQDGRLVIRAIAQNSAPSAEQRYTSARLVSRQTLARDRGVLTGIILSPCAEGIWPAFWLLPQEPFSWPVDGEVDIAETWNGDHENRTCLHWGFHHEQQKHRVIGTKIPDMHARPVRYDFAWDQPGGHAGQGRMVWYIDGRPVMKAPIPEGTRPMRDMTILLNVAMGGSVCGGKVPADGYYDMVVQTLFLGSEPEYGGWGRFEHDWANPSTPYGNTY
ncbi:family 16 glycoside hydrolase [Dactylonectria macrodidyma]|uniref:Family 16 glycoside hydrolase n=1 Tax=Dactylonectria macrodidyma TaxID=307937 RepID=A0A9P9JM79_9HYPO|nr:family 16 glycoside hydrolase [Dactylonectria macrodidyma]